MWRKSRRSANGQDCVELRDTLDRLRDSKNPAGPVLRADIRAFLLAIRAGQFDH